MALKEDLSATIEQVLKDEWKARDGRVVPTSESIASNGGRVDMTAALLYADLADSTKIATAQPLPAARLFKAYLGTSARIIRSEGGEIRSFDGDRIMAVFAGDTPSTSAVRTALKINWAFLNLITPKFQRVYPRVFGSGAPHTLAHAVGVDTSKFHVVRAGIRDNADLVWVGRAPNVAAKLSGIREAPFNCWITKAVYDAMVDTTRVSADGRNMWEERQWSSLPGLTLYRSSWSWILQ